MSKCHLRNSAYVHRLVLLSAKLLFAVAADNGETNNWSMCREPVTTECSARNWAFLSPPFGSGNIAEDMGERTEESEDCFRHYLQGVTWPVYLCTLSKCDYVLRTSTNLGLAASPVQHGEAHQAPHILKTYTQFIAIEQGRDNFFFSVMEQLVTCPCS